MANIPPLSPNNTKTIEPSFDLTSRSFRVDNEKNKEVYEHRVSVGCGAVALVSLFGMEGEPHKVVRYYGKSKCDEFEVPVKGLEPEYTIDGCIFLLAVPGLYGIKRVDGEPLEETFCCEADFVDPAQAQIAINGGQLG